MERVLSLTGLSAGSIRTAAQESGFLTGVLRHIIESDPVLLEFAQHAEFRPNEVVSAARALGATDEHS